MTVKELIKELQEFNPDTRVVVNGYEGGFDDIQIEEPRPIALNVHNEWYYGKHDYVSFARDENAVKVDAIVLKQI